MVHRFVTWGNQMIIRIKTLFALLFSFNVFAECSVSNNQFKSNSDGNITDTKTGLTWLKCPIGMKLENAQCVGQSQRMSWEKAKFAIASINSTSNSQWRLPTLGELQSITEQNCYSPAINAEIFPYTLPTGYWSSTGDHKSKQHAAIMFFLHGKSYYSNKQAEWFIRAVK